MLCGSLVDLEIPLAKAKSVRIQSSPLVHASFLLAETVKIENCFSLVTLEAPQAKFVGITYCPLLKSVNIPLAKTVEIKNCKNLNASASMQTSCAG
jgi:hypothetical protein